MSRRAGVQRGLGGGERRCVCVPGLCPVLSQQCAQRPPPAPPAGGSLPSARQHVAAARRPPDTVACSPHTPQAQRASVWLPSRLGVPDFPAVSGGGPAQSLGHWSDAESPAGYTEQSGLSQGRSPDPPTPFANVLEMQIRGPSQADQVRHLGCVSRHVLPARPNLGGPWA